MIQVLQIIVCVLTAVVGALSLFAPERVTGFTGLAPQGGRGITEIRAILGGVFLALGIVPFFLGEVAYTVVGITYLALAVIRFASIFIDRSGTQSNWISLVSEIVFGVILVL
jgi:hypothetical protein